MKKYLIANWKMHGRNQIITEYLNKLSQNNTRKESRVIVCLPHVYLHNAIGNKFSLEFGAQDCSESSQDGAFTGQVSAEMIHDMGGRYIIVGHSERRNMCHETSAVVLRKAASVHEAGCIAIICVGETLEQRQQGQTEVVIAEQLKHSVPPTAAADNTIIAYEPVWAIGTGQTASTADVQRVHQIIKEAFPKIPVVYGGSVNDKNASELLALPNVDGALVGKASMDYDQFVRIINSSALTA